MFKVYQEVGLIYQEHDPIVHCTKHSTGQCTVHYTASILERDNGYTLKYSPLPEGVPEGEPEQTPECGRLYLTLYPELILNTDSISFLRISMLMVP